MKRTYRYIVLLTLIMGKYIYAQEWINEENHHSDISPEQSRFTACFINDSSESRCWQQMLTEANPSARYDFGVHYANGDGVQQSFTKGRYWMHQAALAGLPLAQYNLGVMFFDGIGGMQSKDCAVHWLNKAASASGETREMARHALAGLYELTASAEIPKVYRVLTAEECEQLPEVVFPGGEAEPSQPEETSDSSPAPIEVVLSSDEPFFVEPVLEHNPEGKVYDPMDVEEISAEAVEEQTPLEKTDIEVVEPTVKPSEAEQPDVILFSPADETEELTSAEKKEAHLLADTNIVDPESADALPVVILDSVSESTEVIAPAVTNRAPRFVEKAVPRTLNLGGALRTAPKGHYTLQLGSASQAEAMQTLAKKHKLSNYLVYETERHGRRWYVLVYGEYAGMTQAKQALQQLPGALKKNSPWIRSLAHVHTEL